MQDIQSILITVVVGALAGYLADLAFKSINLSTIYQIGLGILGAFVGKFLFDGEFQTMLGLPEIVSRVIEAFIGSAVILGLVVLYNKYIAKK